MWRVIKLRVQGERRRKSADYKPESVGFCPCYAKNCWVPLVVSVALSSSQLLYLWNVGLGEVIPEIPSGLPSFTINIHWKMHVRLRYLCKDGWWNQDVNPGLLISSPVFNSTLWPPIYFFPHFMRKIDVSTLAQILDSGTYTWAVCVTPRFVDRDIGLKNPLNLWLCL